MSEPTTQDGWIAAADARSSRHLRLAFPAKRTVPLQQSVRAAWESFTYLQGLRRDKDHRGNMPLACAEHFAYARAVVCAGGALVFPFIVSGSLTYQAAKATFEKAGLLQRFGQWVSQGNSMTTPASVDQLAAAIAGADAGMSLHYSF